MNAKFSLKQVNSTFLNNFADKYVNRYFSTFQLNSYQSIKREQVKL